MQAWDLELTVDLDDIETISRIDSSNMIGALEHLPDPLIEMSGRSNHDLRVDGSTPQSLVLMGMGGSGSAADVTLDWLNTKLKIPGIIHRGPSLPAFVNQGTLFIAISYSGQTSETLEAFQAAHRRNCRLVGIGTGGRLHDLCRRFEAPFISVPSALAPRAALSQLIVASATAISRLGLVPSTSIEMVKAGMNLRRFGNRFRKETPTATNPAKQFASKLAGRFVTIYSLDRMSSVARRFKNQLAENSKIASKYEALPEACHNDIESWQSKNHRVPVIIRSREESRFEQVMIRSFKKTIALAIDSRPLEVRFTGEGRLSQLLTSILFLDYVSVYLAILRRVDPTPTEHIVEYRKGVRI